jgi:hypothetical protein
MSNQKRAWEAPVATALSIRATANMTGGGPDTFLRQDISHRHGLAPTAPMVDVGALPVPARESIKAESSQQTWEAPAVTTVSL